MSVGLGLVLDRRAVFLRRHCNPVRKANTPCSRGELISSRAMADNNRIETELDFPAAQKNLNPQRARAQPGPLLRALDRPDRLRARAPRRRPRRNRIRSSANSSSKTAAAPVAKLSTWPPRVLSALRWKCQPGTLTELAAAGNRKPI